MSKPVTVFNTIQHVKLEAHSPQKAEEMMKESQEKCALAIGRQLLKRKLIIFETEETPGPNAGERRITVKGSVNIEKPLTLK